MAERTMRLRNSSRCSIRLMPGSSARSVTAARALPIASAGSTMLGRLGSVLTGVSAGVEAALICPQFVRAGEQRRFGCRIGIVFHLDAALRHAAGRTRRRNLLTGRRWLDAGIGLFLR